MCDQSVECTVNGADWLLAQTGLRCAGRDLGPPSERLGLLMYRTLLTHPHRQQKKLAKIKKKEQEQSSNSGKNRRANKTCSVMSFGRSSGQHTPSFDNTTGAEIWIGSFSEGSLARRIGGSSLRKCNCPLCYSNECEGPTSPPLRSQGGQRQQHLRAAAPWRSSPTSD